MRKTSNIFNHIVFILLFFSFGTVKSQNTGGPYTPDANTILLMHFDGNLNEEASNYAVNNHGVAKSYITSPITGLGNAIYFDNSNPANQSFITVSYSAQLNPNPFNPSTKINYQLSALSKVVLKIYDDLGRKIRTLVNKEQSAGYYSVNFNAYGLTSGIYFYRISTTGRASSFVQTKKMLLIK